MQHILLLCGGKSPEHEISLRSVKNVLAALDRKRFRVSLAGIDRGGSWRLLDEQNLGESVEPGEGIPLCLVPGRLPDPLLRLDNGESLGAIDAIFPMLHGPNGEDGTVQGLLRCLNLPFVGPDVLASSACMDKDVTKRLLRDAGLRIAAFLCFQQHEKAHIDPVGVVNQLGLPLFVKPANMGSSVGVHKVKAVNELQAALEDAFRYDNKVLVEEMIYGREIECAVLGNEVPEVTSVGEVVTPEGYDYESKYISATAAEIIIPAKVSDQDLELAQSVARQAYQAMGCEGLTRVDMFLTEEGDIYVNELNTLPGFTSISMYPKLWAHAGISYTDLISRLLELAIERHTQRNALKTVWK